MAMLAEPRRKQKWTLNPRGKHWSDDSNKFGQKMLEKMGWSSGKGLGANLDGMTEHIRCKFKNDQAGVGFSQEDRDKQWTEHQEGFNELLQKLHKGEAAETAIIVAENELSGKSLELKSKQSRARVHYQKFTRGKDVNKYSTKDLANIFGKKDLDEKEPEKPVDIKQEPEELVPPEPIGSTDNSHGVVTIKGGSISDYFKNKMSALGRKVPTEVPNDSESETETYAGFGLSAVKSETPKKIMETHFSFVNPALDVASPKETTVTPRKRKNEFAFENPALDIASPKETPRKRKSEFYFDNPAVKQENGSIEMEHTPKRRKSDFAFENGGLDLETPQNGGTASVILSTEELRKKKRKKKVKECIPPVLDGFTNEALNLESQENEISNSSQFEVPRAVLGLANDALDLTDETNGRKRVTFNETIEFDTDVASGKRKKKKNKNAGKLDKFEVDNEKLKRKKKKERKEEAADSAFVNEAMDVDDGNQEVNDNAANERKSERARRKRDRRMSNLETIAEVPDEDKENVVEIVTLDESLVGQTSEGFEDLSLETPKKKKKKKKTKKSRETENSTGNQEADLSTTIDIREENVELVEEILPLHFENLREKVKNEKVEEEESGGKKSKRKKKDSVACKQEEMEVKDVNVETADITKTEKRMKKIASECLKENVDTENFVAAAEKLVEVETAKKKKKQKKGKKQNEEESGNVKIEEGANVNIEKDEKKTVDEGNLETEPQSPWDGKAKKSKRTFKALFARSPVVNFVGSNINEIKGYGMDI